MQVVAITPAEAAIIAGLLGGSSGFVALIVWLVRLRISKRIDVATAEHLETESGLFVVQQIKALNETLQGQVGVLNGIVKTQGQRLTQQAATIQLLETKVKDLEDEKRRYEESRLKNESEFRSMKNQLVKLGSENLALTERCQALEEHNREQQATIEDLKKRESRLEQQMGDPEE